MKVVLQKQRMKLFHSSKVNDLKNWFLLAVRKSWRVSQTSYSVSFFLPSSITFFKCFFKLFVWRQLQSRLAVRMVKHDPYSSQFLPMNGNGTFEACQLRLRSNQIPFDFKNNAAGMILMAATTQNHPASTSPLFAINATQSSSG